MDIALDSPTGYILEVDLESATSSMRILTYCFVRRATNRPASGRINSSQFYTSYVIHYRNLQQCTSRLPYHKDLPRIAISQSSWLRTYTELNTNFRTLAKNDFEKNLYILMNNAVFGKTMENVRNHVNVRLVTQWEGRYGAKALIAKPNFHSRSIFSENLIAIEMRKLEVKFNKPIYVGTYIFDISKTCLYEFHHDYMSSTYREKCKVIYTNTDSLIYHIECDDVYEIMKRDINRFDTSDYAVDNVALHSSIKKFQA